MRRQVHAEEDEGASEALSRSDALRLQVRLRLEANGGMFKNGSRPTGQEGTVVSVCFCDGLAYWVKDGKRMQTEPSTCSGMVGQSLRGTICYGCGRCWRTCGVCCRSHLSQAHEPQNMDAGLKKNQQHPSASSQHLPNVLLSGTASTGLLPCALVKKSCMLWSAQHLTHPVCLGLHTPAPCPRHGFCWMDIIRWRPQRAWAAR